MHQTQRPLIIDQGQWRHLHRCSLGKADGTFSEADIQRLVDEHPEIMPTMALFKHHAKCMSLGREISVPLGGARTGYIDNLLITDHGQLIVVEAKLYRNPEARRKVIGQALEYAAALSKFDYAALRDALIPTHVQIDEKGDVGPDPLHSHVKSHLGDDLRFEEHEFIDVISRRLKEGDFAVVVLGDGIRQDVEHLADLLERHPTLNYRLSLIELQLYSHTPDNTPTLIIPVVLAQTEVLQRVVVEIKSSDTPAVHITPDQPPTMRPQGRRQWDEDAFFGELEVRMGAVATTDVRAIYQAGLDLQGQVNWGTGTSRGSFNLIFTALDENKSWVTVYTDGTLQLNYNWVNVDPTVLGRQLEALDVDAILGKECFRLKHDDWSTDVDGIRRLIQQHIPNSTM